MEYRRLGRTGLMVSVVSYGTAPLGDMYGTSSDDVALQSAYRALDAGINFFDSSPSLRRGAGRGTAWQGAAGPASGDHRRQQGRQVRT
jgi:aryl-alcohol dehydrogenase-like predicted oxidoreductase